MKYQDQKRFENDNHIKGKKRFVENASYEKKLYTTKLLSLDFYKEEKKLLKENSY